ncbi:MAG: helix-turn-helix domain-containing protein [Chloroflexota bacterium]
MPPITVRDVQRLALPSETVIVAGANHLSHQVSWVVMQRATPPAFANLRGGELALVSIKAIQALDEHLTLTRLIERLARVPIAAIAAIGPIPELAQTTAESVRMPLLHLPDSSSLREVEREIQRLISDYDAQIERRAAQLSTLLTQASLGGAGLNELLDVLTERTGHAIGCYSATGEVRALRGRGPARVALQTLHPRAPGTMTHLAQSVWVQPLGTAGDRLGFLAIAGTTLDDWDRLATQQGSTAIALELAKEQAVQAAEDRLRGDFVHAVLMGPPADSEALFQRAQELGYNLRLPHVALLCSVIPRSSNEAPSETVVVQAANLLNTSLATLNVSAPTMRRADGTLCYLPLRDQATRARDIVEKLRTHMIAEMPNITIALGKEASNVAAWPRSLREAEQALLIGRQLFGNSRVLDFSDLGVYRLLLLLRESPELWDFYRTNLSGLAEYDQKQGNELLKTLEAFFASLGNLARTSEVLHVHRNTLLYRLKRIQEITGMDLDNAEDRLALWLSLKAHRVLESMDHFDGEG